MMILKFLLSFNLMLQVTSIVWDSLNFCSRNSPRAYCDSTDHDNGIHIRPNCSIPDEVTARFTFSTSVDIHKQKEIRMECHSTDNQGLDDTQIVCSSTRTGGGTGKEGPFTFRNLNMSGILPGWTCAISGCFEDYDGKSLRSDIASCVLQGVPAPTTTQTLMTSNLIIKLLTSIGPTTSTSRINTTCLGFSTSSSATLDVTSSGIHNQLTMITSHHHEDPHTYDSFLAVSTVTVIPSTASTTLSTVSKNTSQIVNVIAPSVSVILLVSATLAIALICGTAHICTKRKRMALRTATLTGFNNETMVFDPNFVPVKYNTVTLVLRASKISDDIQCMNPSLTPQSELGQANEQPLQKTDQRSNTVEEKYLNMDASSGLVGVNNDPVPPSLMFGTQQDAECDSAGEGLLQSQTQAIENSKGSLSAVQHSINTSYVQVQMGTYNMPNVKTSPNCNTEVSTDFDVGSTLSEASQESRFIHPSEQLDIVFDLHQPCVSDDKEIDFKRD